MIVEELIATLGLKTDAASFNRGEDRIGQLGKSVARVGAIAAALATAVSAVTISITREFATMADSSVKFADSIGTSVESLQELRYAADLSGIATSALDKSLERMNRRIGFAAQGRGAAKNSLQQLGVDAQALSRLDASEQIGVIADAINQVGDASARAGIAFDIFGMDGQKMLTLLKSGSAGINDLRGQARDTGGVFSEKSARDAEEFNDHLTKTRMIMRAITNAISADLLPIFNRLLTRFGEMFSRNREAIIAGIGKAIEFVGIAMKFLAYAAVLFIGLKLVVYFGALVGILAKLRVAMIIAWEAAFLPLVVGIAALTALILLLDELYTWAHGGESVFGDWFDFMASGFEKIRTQVEWLLKAVRTFSIVDQIKKLGEFGLSMIPGKSESTGSVTQNNEININGEGMDAKSVGNAVMETLANEFFDAVRMNETGRAY